MRHYFCKDKEFQIFISYGVIPHKLPFFLDDNELYIPYLKKYPITVLSTRSNHLSTKDVYCLETVVCDVLHKFKKDGIDMCEQKGKPQIIIVEATLLDRPNEGSTSNMTKYSVSCYTDFESIDDAVQWRLMN